MRSEKVKVRSESSPLEGSGCRSVSGGRRGVMRVRAINWFRARFHTHQTHTCQFRSTLNCLSTLKPHMVPIFSGRGLPIAVALLIAIFIVTMTTSLHAQGSELSTNSVDTPQVEPGTSGSTVSPRGEISNYPKLEEYIRIAIEENPELRSLRHLYEAEKERAREVGVLPDPELNIMYDFNPMMSESQLGRFSVSAMQMFPWFGTLNTRKEAQRSAAEADRARIDLRQLEILRDMQIAWFNIVEIREQIQITEQNIELVQELEQLVEIRYETGQAAQADILRIQMEEQRLKNRVENLEDLLNPLKATFNEYLNRDPGTEVETAVSIQLQPVGYTEEQIEELVKAQNPAFEVLEARGRSLDYQNHAAKLSGRPSFGLGVEVMGRDFGPMSMLPDASESVIGMATVRLPIFRSRTRSQQQQINERIRALDFDLNQTENRLAAEVETVLERIRNSERYIRLLDEELIPRAQQAFDILTEEYSVGRAWFDELLQIQRELLDLELERIEAVVGQNKAVVRIESLIGNSPPLKGESATGAGG
jgi:outer membrane protein, heavy metal efflux system